jgi:hypothetical protein
MDEIILITDFSNTSKKKLILKNLITQINSKYEICLSSHCVQPFDIIEDVDFYVYDKKNPHITNNSLKGIRYFTANDFTIFYKFDFWFVKFIFINYFLTKLFPQIIASCNSGSRFWQ